MESDIEDPLQIIELFLDAINSGNPDAAAALCDEQSQVTTPDGDLITGKDAIRAWTAELTTRHARLVLEDSSFDGATVTGILEIANDYHREVGLAPLYVDFTGKVVDGKLQSFGGSFTPESMAKVQRFRDQNRG